MRRWTDLGPLPKAKAFVMLKPNPKVAIVALRGLLGYDGGAGAGYRLITNTSSGATARRSPYIIFLVRLYDAIGILELIVPSSGRVLRLHLDRRQR